MLSNPAEFDTIFRQYKIEFYIILIILIGTISMTGLNGSLEDTDSAKYANAAWETHESKSLIPVRNGQYYLHKSTVVYWTAMISFKVFGVNDFAARSPSALASILSAILIFLIVDTLAGSYTAGSMAVFIYLTSIQVYASAHMITADPLMVMTVLGSLYFLLMGIPGKRNWILLAALCNGFKCLTKSVVGLAVPGAVFIYIILEKRWSLLKYFAVFVLISLDISLPYFVRAHYKAPATFIDTFLKTNIADRVLADAGFSFQRILQVLKTGLR